MIDGRMFSAMGLVTAAGLAFIPAATAQAQELLAAPVNTGKVGFELGVTGTTEYWFRGIAQENQGLILQPYFTATFDLLSKGNITLDGYAGIWNSVHSGNPSSSGSDNAWYEADAFAGVVMGLPAYNLSFDLSYVYYHSPASGVNFSEEIDLEVRYDDSDVMEALGIPFTLAPRARVAVEIDNGADAGPDKGTYLEVGIEPAFALTDGSDYPLTLTIPVTAGFSIDDYYQDAAGDDDTFGFLDVGAVVSTPLPFIPSSYGAWTVSAGLHYLMLGDSAADLGRDLGVTDGDDHSVYATIGLSMNY